MCVVFSVWTDKSAGGVLDIILLSMQSLLLQDFLCLTQNRIVFQLYSWSISEYEKNNPWLSRTIRIKYVFVVIKNNSDKGNNWLLSASKRSSLFKIHDCHNQGSLARSCHLIKKICVYFDCLVFWFAQNLRLGDWNSCNEQLKTHLNLVKDPGNSLDCNTNINQIVGSKCMSLYMVTKHIANLTSKQIGLPNHFISMFHQNNWFSLFANTTRNALIKTIQWTYILLQKGGYICSDEW